MLLDAYSFILPDMCCQGSFIKLNSKVQVLTNNIANPVRQVRNYSRLHLETPVPSGHAPSSTSHIIGYSRFSKTGSTASYSMLARENDPTTQ